jgi:predicted AAA+ superfamily ATPase
MEHLRAMEHPLHTALCCISVYQPVTSLPPMAHLSSLLSLLEETAPSPQAVYQAYTGIFYSLSKDGYDTLGAWLFDRLRFSDSPYGEAAGKGLETPALRAAAEREIDTLARAARLSCQGLKEKMARLLPAPWAGAVSLLPEWPCGVPFDFQSLTAFYRVNGSGIFASCRAFVWENQQLTPVPNPDMPQEEELVGYQMQRDQVVENTHALLAGHFVNNVLLYGESGTGKSATVKSLLSVPGFENLRLIEVQKEQLDTLPRLMRYLNGKKQKFILFLDDLTFETGDTTPSVLKTILEGGLEPRPVNTAIYATSNRRHLIREFFSERDKGDELDPEETIQEKTSLTERFGLRIPYLGLNQADFLALVERLAAKERLSITPPVLQKKALQWEMHHPGRTPRAARQFIASLKMDANGDPK